MAVNVLALFNEIAQRVQPDTQAGPLKPDMRLEALGIDSISLMEIVDVLEDELSISIPDEKLLRVETLGDVEKAIQEQLAQRGG